jgi:hypothetical protein
VTALDFPSLWERAIPWSRYFDPGMQQYSLWGGVYRHARPPDWAIAAGRELAPLRLLVLTEDWCGDASNTVPVMQRWVEALPGSELRALPRDQFPAVMDRYLTDGARSIPIAIGLDSAFREIGHWGPRPAELQAWVMANMATTPKDQRYARIRRWYARDKGETTLRELVQALRPTAA